MFQQGAKKIKNSVKITPEKSNQQDQNKTCEATILSHRWQWVFKRTLLLNFNLREYLIFEFKIEFIYI